MRRLKLLIFLLVGFFILPNVAFAASGTIKVTGTSTVVLGNTATVTVTISSSTAIGSWQMELNYDKSYLQLTSASSEAGGTIMANSSATGVKSKSYTFKFKTLKKGSAKVSVNSYEAYAFSDLSEISLTPSSKTLKILTKEELEDTYSSNAALKKLEVTGYNLTPEFDKKTLNYTLDVENDVEKVTISASKDDANASVSGTGEVTLQEGNNTFEVTVTAQKGNQQTYTIDIYRKELNPITITIKDEDYTIERKSENFPPLSSFSESTITYNGEEIPALYNEITGMTLIVVKNSAGHIKTFIYENSEIGNEYIELKSNQLTINPMPLPKKVMDNYLEREVMINENTVSAYSLNKDDNFVIIYAQDVDTGDIGYYQYDIKNNVISHYDKDIIDYYEGKIQQFKYVIMGFMAFTIFLVFLLIVRRPRTKKMKVREKTILDD